MTDWRGELRPVSAGPDKPDWSRTAGALEAAADLLDMTDYSPLVVCMATGVTVYAASDPLWAMLVAPPSSAKTECITLMKPLTALATDSTTEAAMLHWRKSKPGRSVPLDPHGWLLDAVGNGNSALVTISDLSTMMRKTNGPTHGDAFAALRRVYDGQLSRDITPDSPTTPGTRLEWSGRVTMVAAVTAAIDRMGGFMQELGPRFLLYRITEETLERRRAISRGMSTGGGGSGSGRSVSREMAQEAVTAAVRAGQAALPGVVLSEELANLVTDAALFCSMGRASVPRDTYGKKEIEGIAEVEGPARVTQALMLLARGLLALGVDDVQAGQIVCKMAFDSMTAIRARVLRALWDAATAAGTPEAGRMSTAQVMTAVRADRRIVRSALEDLHALDPWTGDHLVSSAPRETRSLAELSEDAESRAVGTWWWLTPGLTWEITDRVVGGVAAFKPMVGRR